VTIDVLKVSSKSNPNSVAGALAGVVRSTGSVEIQVVGAGALNQAVKAIAIARGYMATAGQDLMCRPTFADIRIDGENRTAIRLRVETCAALPAAPVAVDGSAAADGHAAGSHTADGHAAGVPTPAVTAFPAADDATA
jgi:stage V sporulation protein S